MCLKCFKCKKHEKIRCTVRCNLFMESFEVSVYMNNVHYTYCSNKLWKFFSNCSENSTVDCKVITDVIKFCDWIHSILLLQCTVIILNTVQYCAILLQIVFPNETQKYPENPCSVLLVQFL